MRGGRALRGGAGPRARHGGARAHRTRHEVRGRRRDHTRVSTQVNNARQQQCWNDVHSICRIGAIIYISLCCVSEIAIYSHSSRKNSAFDNTVIFPPLLNNTYQPSYTLENFDKT